MMEDADDEVSIEKSHYDDHNDYDELASNNGKH